MKYFIDTEFIEGKQRLRKTWFEALTTVKKLTEPTIDLISIGIVAEDGREYYAISKDFNLNEAWFRYDEVKVTCPIEGTDSGITKKVYWLRDNVLKPIYLDLLSRETGYNFKDSEAYKKLLRLGSFELKQLKWLLKKYGKSNNTIAEEIKHFCLYSVKTYKFFGGKYVGGVDPYENTNEFYGYYADYDWVVFCWLFGNMNDLPSGFPMYCRDLKQMLDTAINNIPKYGNYTFEESMKIVKNYSNYPRQTNEHNALADARWNFELYKFLKQL